MMIKILHEIDKILRVLLLNNFKMVYSLEPLPNNSYEYPNQNGRIRATLIGEKNCIKATQYLKKYDDFYWEMHKKFKKILSNGNFDPDNEYQLLSYYIKPDTYEELDIVYDMALGLDKKESIALIGEKGSGKTALLNCWIYKNKQKLEENNIFWVRCDGHSLYKLWTTKPVYKEWMDAINFNTKAIKWSDNAKRIIGHIEEIYFKNLKNIVSSNDIISIMGKALGEFIDLMQVETLEKSESDLLRDNVVGFFLKPIIKEIHLVSIEDFLSVQLVYIFCKNMYRPDDKINQNILNYIYDRQIEYDHQVSRNDGACIQKEKRSLMSGLLDMRDKILKYESVNNLKRNYAIDHVMGKSGVSKHRREFNVWLSMSSVLSDVFSKNGYKILRIVDGVDNVHMNDNSSRIYYDSMLAFSFNYLKRATDNHYINLMVMRERTFIECVGGSAPMQDTTGYVDIHQINNIAVNLKNIFNARLKYSSDKFIGGSVFEKICNKISDSIDAHSINKISHNNARTFLYNKLSLTSLVYYRMKQRVVPDYIQNIENHINTFETRNLFLNGRLFLNTKEDWHYINSEIGMCSMNIFYFDLNKFPCSNVNEWQGLCKTRIMQLIDKYSGSSEDFIRRYLLDGYNYSEGLIDQNIADLKAFGMIDTKYQGRIYLEVSDKGKHYLAYSYGNIDTLYYFALDSPLPRSFTENKYFYCHNNKFNCRTNYPLASISTSMIFIMFLNMINLIEKSRIEQNKDKIKQIFTDYLKVPDPYYEFEMGKKTPSFNLPFHDVQSLIYRNLLSSIENILRGSDGQELRKMDTLLEEFKSDL